MAVKKNKKEEEKKKHNKNRKVCWLCQADLKKTVMEAVIQLSMWFYFTMSSTNNAKCTCVSFWLHNFCGYWEGWDPINRFYHISLTTIVTPIYRSKSVWNRCVIGVFGGAFVLSLDFHFLMVLGIFVIGLGQISYVYGNFQFESNLLSPFKPLKILKTILLLLFTKPITVSWYLTPISYFLANITKRFFGKSKSKSYQNY